ncbi:MAG: DNA recombination protein RmuC [Duncaniella sp.]|nr:DNA recombination protein RmuC [Duncaniella sp.]
MAVIAGLLAVVSAAALFFLSKTYSRFSAVNAELTARRGEVETLRERLLESDAAGVKLQEALIDSERRCAAAEASLQRIEEERGRNEEMLRSNFANIATEILNSNSSRFKAESEERLNSILSPLRENLESFRKVVTDTYNAEARERFSLEKEISKLINVNDTISREARELTQALRGNNAVQGEWGEIVLETILEKSGLIQGEEYFVQSSRDADGNTMHGDAGGVLRPDVVVRYPDKRCVVIDSKCSLTAFIEYVNADDKAAAKAAGDRHLLSVKSHVERLSKKKYQDYIGASQLDYVMMFIPSEPAYMAAMRLDVTLWQYAYDRRVLIVSPTHLVAALRLIAQLWNRDKVTKNAIRIAEDAGKMYDKFVEFVNDMEKIDKSLASASKAHYDAMKKLSTGTGSLVKRASDLKSLGIKASKQLKLQAPDEIDSELASDEEEE